MQIYMATKVLTLKSILIPKNKHNSNSFRTIIFLPVHYFRELDKSKFDPIFKLLNMMALYLMHNC